jgi:hypothetical protein
MHSPTTNPFDAGNFSNPLNINNPYFHTDLRGSLGY